MEMRIALCVEEEACRNPQIIGLEGETLDSQQWLDVYTRGAEARAAVAARETGELWVVSCDDVEPINLAASVKSDVPEMRVSLVTAESCGSLLSRAHTANIDEVFGFSDFVKRYLQRKSEYAARASFSENEVPVAAAEANHPMETTPPAETIPPVEVIADEPRPAISIAPYLQAEPNRVLVSAPPENRAFVLTVVSGSGGSGKSSVSALGALSASSWGYKTLLLDCDLQFGDVASMVGVEQPLSIDEVLAHPERLEAEIPQTGGLTVLAAPLRLEASEEVVGELPALLEWVRGLFDVVVINTGASWAEQHAVLLERSSVALFLVDQRVSSVRACRHALELCARCGIAAAPFQYALNRCGKGQFLSTMDVSSALQGAPVLELKDGGRDVEDYLSGGAAAELIEARNEFAKSVGRMMERLLPGGARLSADAVTAPEEKRPFRRKSRHTADKRGRRRQ